MNHEGSKNSRSKLYVLRFITVAKKRYWTNQANFLLTREICIFTGHDQKVSIDFTELKLIEMKTHVLAAAAVHLWQKKKLPELVGGSKLKSLESQWAIVIGYSVYNDAVIFFGFPSAAG